MIIPNSSSVAALYDMHGNLPAVEAVLSQMEGNPPDLVVIGGDIVLGPMPRETLERLRALGPRAHFLRGNCDRLVVDAFDGRPLPRLPDAVAETISWTAQQLTAEHRDFLAHLPTTLIAAVEGMGDVLFCHASPRSDEEILTVVTSAERVRPMLDGVTQSVVICGHTHMQYDRQVDGVRLVNAGSVGMPYGLPGAYWLLLGPDVCRVRTEYDLTLAAAQVRETSYPQAVAFAAGSILSAPSEQAMLSAFHPVK